jgi:ATP-dependent protease HslVU (ClpYQ) peptidase subunit
MTCIAGVVSDGKVYIGGDSAGSDGYSMVDRADAKVFANGPFLFGFTTSFRMGQLLRYAFAPPPRHPDKDVMAYMVTDFIDHLRKCLQSGGFATKKDDAERGGTFLVGYEGRLFKIEGDYQVGESSDGYDACGSGESYALGSLYSTSDKPGSPKGRVTDALKAAEAHSSFVRGPFHIISA